MNKTSNSVTDFVKGGVNMKDGFANFVAQPNLASPGKTVGFMNDAAGTYQAIHIKENRKSNFSGEDQTVIFEFNNSKNPADGIKITQRKPISDAQKLRWGIGSLGSVAGILLAVHRKSGFWGGVGWWILGGMAGGAIGWIVTSKMDEEK